MEFPTARQSDNRHSLDERRIARLGDVGDANRHSGQARHWLQTMQRLIAQTAPGSGVEHEFGCHTPQAIVASMRPTTALVVAGLLVLIVGAFLWQLWSSGSTP